MNKSIVFVLIAVAVAAACTKESAPSAGKLVKMTFSADADPVTKTSLHTDGKSVNWIAEDQISVFVDGAGTPEAFTASSVDGKNATFTGYAQTGDEFVALYPHDASATLSGTTLTTSIPAVQTAIKGGFADDLNLMVATTTKAESHFSFRNLCALIKVTVPEAAADNDLSKIASITLRTEKAVTGKFTYDLEAGTVAASSDKTGSVMLKAAEDALEAGTYYFVVSPSAADETQTMYLNVKMTDGRSCVIVSQSVKKFSLNGNTIYDLGTLSLENGSYTMIDLLDYNYISHNAGTWYEDNSGGMIKISGGVATIGSSKRWSKLSWKYTAPKTGTYTPYIYAASKNSGGYVGIWMRESTSEKAWESDHSQSVVQRDGVAVSGTDWNAYSKYNTNTSLSMQKGTEYDVCFVLYHTASGSYCPNIKEIGFDVE